MVEKLYDSEKITIHWKPDLCAHAGKCVKGNPKVFKVGRRPWIMPENGEDDEIAKVIDQCPSGALSYERK